VIDRTRKRAVVQRWAALSSVACRVPVVCARCSSDRP
jgi:hypothetical protein